MASDDRWGAAVNAAIDAAVSDVLTHVHVMELSTIGKHGLLNTRPMNGVWLPDVHQVILTTPVAYPAKAFNVRRDSRVAVFCSDLTGSGLEGRPTVLIQGTGTALDVVTARRTRPSSGEPRSGSHIHPRNGSWTLGTRSGWSGSSGDWS